MAGFQVVRFRVMNDYGMAASGAKRSFIHKGESSWTVGHWPVSSITSDGRMSGVGASEHSHANRPFVPALQSRLEGHTQQSP